MFAIDASFDNPAYGDIMDQGSFTADPDDPIAGNITSFNWVAFDVFGALSDADTFTGVALFDAAGDLTSFDVSVSDGITTLIMSGDANGTITELSFAALPPVFAQGDYVIRVGQVRAGAARRRGRRSPAWP